MPSGLKTWTLTIKTPPLFCEMSSGAGYLSFVFHRVEG